MKIMAGLGNPGEKYTFTRHNAGFLFIDYWAQLYNVRVNRLRFRALCGEHLTEGGEKLLVMKPQTYMNLSGEAVFAAAEFYKIAPQDILVVADDASLPVGALRIRKKGSDGGHNGLKSIIQLLGSDDFPRIKIGIGRPENPEWELAEWVLGAFPKDEQKLLFETLKKAAKAAELIGNGQTEKAMNDFNAIPQND